MATIDTKDDEIKFGTPQFREGPWLQSANGFSIKRITIKDMDYPVFAPDYLDKGSDKMTDFISLQYKAILKHAGVKK